jgi:ergothioneine biosynthesis protein EgtB
MHETTDKVRRLRIQERKAIPPVVAVAAEVSRKSQPVAVRLLRASDLATAYRQVRAQTVALCSPLHIEDYVVQSMPDASPAKWHLAHTAWFFDQFVVKPEGRSSSAASAAYEHLFNSYYQSVGAQYPRERRGVLSRPTVREVLQYREAVDAQVLALLEQEAPAQQLLRVVEIGIEHERQHQELLLTDLKHLFSCNPLRPVYAEPRSHSARQAPELRFLKFAGGIATLGTPEGQFHFDNESPPHAVMLEDFALGNRPITNGEFRDFVRAGAYSEPLLWLADGWSHLKAAGISRPLYWSEDLESEFTLSGDRELDIEAPVCHLSYYEADAFARWAGARLPTEAEWESVARGEPVSGNLLPAGRLHPAPARTTDLTQLFGDVWEWTSSAYGPYPGFRAPAGAIGEYNGKFMCNQIVLRGGSCVTPGGHIRAGYRNFFYPTARWQFSGLRLAQST